MEKKTETAIDLIYDMPLRLDKIERSQKMLDDKLNSIIALLKKLELHADQAVPTEAQDEPDEVMEIRTPVGLSPAVKAKIEEIKAEPIVKDEPIISMKPAPADFEVFNSPETKAVSVLVKGKYKGKDGLGIAGIEIKITNSVGQIVKRTKTTSLGDWLVMLPAGEYMGEFAKPGIAPLIKPITILPGKKEIEIII